MTVTSSRIKRAEIECPISDQSIANGSQTLQFPDFTEGNWRGRKGNFAPDDRY